LKKDVISLQHLPAADIIHLIKQAVEMKKEPDKYTNALSGRVLLMLFQKTSTRTRLSFELGIGQLGGRAVMMDWQSSNFAISPIRYEAKYVSRHVDLIMARLIKHEQLLELAAGADVPVINGCCNRYHPTQGLADLLTIYEKTGDFSRATLAYIGIHNNVANSLVAGALKTGLRLILITPEVNPGSWDADLMAAAARSGLIEVTADLQKAREADFVYTDTWVDMENFHNPAYAEEKERRLKMMMPYQMRAEIFAGRELPYIMHDMPIHPGLEIEAGLIEAPTSVIYEQAENRLHVEKSLMLYLLS